MSDDIETTRDSEVSESTGQETLKSKWYPGKYVGLNGSKNRSKSYPPEMNNSKAEPQQNQHTTTTRQSETSRSSITSINGTKSKWYPGKLVGLKNRRKSQSNGDEDDEGDDEHDDYDRRSESVSTSGQTTWTTYGGEESERSQSKSSVSNWLRSFSRQDLQSVDLANSTDSGLNNKPTFSDEQQDELDRKEDNNSPTTTTNNAPGNYLGWFRRTSSQADTDSTDPEGGEKTSESDESKKESLIAKTIRAIRNKFIDRKLQGRILIYRMSGLVSTAVTCDILTGDKRSFHGPDPNAPEDFSDLSFQDKRALTMTDSILNSLERRSRAWDGVDFSAEVLLTRGATVGVSDPFIGIIGWSFTLDISATVKSLLASRKRYEQKVKFERESSGRESFLSRSVSFSFPSRGAAGLKDSLGTTSNTTSTSPKTPPKSTFSAALTSVDEDRPFIASPIVPVIQVPDDRLANINFSDSEGDDEGRTESNESGGIKEI